MKYYGRVKVSVGSIEAARFLQIEDQLLAIIDLQITSNLPLSGKDTEVEWVRKNMRYAIVCAAALFIGLGLAVAGQGQTQAVTSKVTVPAGTRILIRMVNSVDSSKQQVGYRFTANLETNLQLDDVVVAPRGSIVYGQLANAKSAGNMSGGAVLTLELPDIVIKGTAYPLLTSSYQVVSQGQGSKKAKESLAALDSERS